jgi:hypothetical protein
MARHAEISAAAAGRDRVTAVTAIRNPHPACEVAAALHTGEHGGYTSELMPMRERLGEECHMVACWAAVSRAADMDPVAGVDLVGMYVE